jgi:hypothetical protein
MSKVRSIQFKKQHIIALVAIIAAGVIVGQVVGLWAGLAAAAVVLGVNEVIERRVRA